MLSTQRSKSKPKPGTEVLILQQSPCLNKTPYAENFSTCTEAVVSTLIFHHYVLLLSDIGREVSRTPVPCSDMRELRGVDRHVTYGQEHILIVLTWIKPWQAQTSMQGDSITQAHNQHRTQEAYASAKC